MGPNDNSLFYLFQPGHRPNTQGQIIFESRTYKNLAQSKCRQFARSELWSNDCIAQNYGAPYSLCSTQQGDEPDNSTVDWSWTTILTIKPKLIITSFTPCDYVLLKKFFVHCVSHLVVKCLHSTLFEWQQNLMHLELIVSLQMYTLSFFTIHQTVEQTVKLLQTKVIY